MINNIATINSLLLELTEGNEEYAQFNKRIVNTNKTVLGVRIPDLRKLAQKLAKDSSLKDIDQLLNSIDPKIYENTLLAGLTITYSSLSSAEQIELAKKYLKLVDSWAEIDSFVPKRRHDLDQWWDFADDCLSSPHEFTVRYGVVEMMGNFLTEDRIKSVFDRLRQVKHNGYYVKMGMAWLYASAAVKFYHLTIDEVTTAPIDPWTKAKALQKMLESRCFDDQQKQIIRTLRQKLKTK